MLVVLVPYCYFTSNLRIQFQNTKLTKKNKEHYDSNNNTFRTIKKRRAITALPNTDTG
jgi:hypothetical protein